MPKLNTHLLATALAAIICSLSCAQSPEKISFNRDIRPILSDNCFQCHGPDEESRATDLRFDSKESAFQDLGGYHAIVSGDSQNSDLISRINDDDEDVIMPPVDSGKKLSVSEKALLKKWIDQGAEWSEFWAYVPPQKNDIPKIENDNWSRNWIDKFVLARLTNHSLKPAPTADRVTLLRRIYFDLIGLPPTPEQVDTFLDDDSDQAFEKVVDQLLESKHFGERLAIYWLDLVRYADTVGYHGDQDHNISPYRDWVINAFNDNMPFDQFTQEQLAGDLLPNPTESQLIASGYNRLLQTTHEGGLQPMEYRAIYAADRVRNVSVVWMGATVGCAQCHDHKYDPYTAKDFYSMAAFFADIDDEQHFKVGTNALPTKRPPEILVIDEASRTRLAELSSRINDSEANRKQVEAILKKQGKDADDETKQKLATIKSQLAGLRKEHKAIESRGAWTMITKALAKPRVTRVLPRGNWLDESGAVVTPAIPSFLGNLAQNENQIVTRLELAHWFTDRQSGGPLTARVMANRIWSLFMGVGISKSLDDFGGQGHPPVHPELLDNLAIEFIASDWNIKQLIREIVTSQTYRQSSLESPIQRQRDPYNQLFSHQSRFRLPAEIVRDNALAISGLLNVEQIGGKSVKPYQPGGYYRHLNFPPRKYSHHVDHRQWQRGVYVHWQRQFLHPALKSLDAPTREECTAERSKSNTPLAALTLMNDPVFVEAARVFAERIMRHENDAFDSRLDYAFRLAVSRSPDDAEQTILKELFNASLQDYEKDRDAAKKLMSVGLSPVPAGLNITQLAAWTVIARAILNMDETISRN